MITGKKINHILKSIYYCINNEFNHTPTPSINDLPSEMERLGIMKIWRSSTDTVDQYSNLCDISITDKNKLYMSEFIDNISSLVIDVENIITFT